MKLYYLFFISNVPIDGHEYIKLGNGFAHSGTCKKCKTDLESIIRKVVKEERSQW